MHNGIIDVLSYWISYRAHISSLWQITLTTPRTLHV